MAPALRLDNPDQLARLRDDVERETARRGLAGYSRVMWHTLEPRTRPLVEGWAFDAICEHLEAVTRGHIKRLLMTVPPGMTKSMLTRVFWPTWEWGPMEMPAIRTVGSSYHGNLAMRDNRRSKLVMESDKYRRLWPHVERSHDQWGNMRLANTSTGFMLATSVGGLGTGERGDRFVIDDPHNVKQGESRAVMEDTVFWFHEVVPSRINDDDSAIVIIMQRVAVGDVADQAIELGYEHLMLPMEYESARHCTTSIGFSDPRTEEGELLAPERFSRDRVRELQQSLGSYGTASQLQQRPAARGGNLIKVEHLELMQNRPDERRIKRRVRYFDKGASDSSTADYSASARVALVEGVYGEPDFYLVEHVWRGQYTSGPRERKFRALADGDPEGTSYVVEQEPGAGGKESAEGTVRTLRGYSCRIDKKGTDKVRNADPYITAVENGMVRYLPGEWNADWIDEQRAFDAGDHDDQVDATAGAYNYLHRRKRSGAL